MWPRKLTGPGSVRIQANVQSADTFASREEAFAVARADNNRPPERYIDSVPTPA